MKIIICSNGVKRKITGSFSICGSCDDLELLAKTITDKLEEKRFAYGWVDIVAEPINQPPLDWFQGGKE